VLQQIVMHSEIVGSTVF